MFTINFCKVNTNYFNHCKTISYNTFMLKNTERLNICQHFKHQEFSSKNNRETRKKCESALGKNKKLKNENSCLQLIYLDVLQVISNHQTTEIEKHCSRTVN